VPAFVVDASFALKWFLADEEDRAPSLALLKRISETNRPIVPWLWFYEIGNALTTAERRNRIALEQLEEILLILGQMPIDIDSSNRADLLRLPHLARKHGLTVYDAAYLNLAVREKIPLATADDDLRKAAVAEGLALI
jgi:predicted nucleic acid-binding protein